MACKEIFEKLEEQLNCSICLDTYTDPKLLQCFHVYCRQCLMPLVVRDQQGQLGVTCPTCRQVTPIPGRGVSGLQPAFHINSLLEIQESIQQLENPRASQEGGLVGGDAVHTSPGVFVRHCLKHTEEELKLYCETCEELVCLQCIMRDGKHHDHDYAVLKKAFEKYKKEISTSLEPMEKQVTTVKEVLKQLDARCEEISDQRTATEDNIHVTVRRLHEVLDIRATELIGQVNQLTQSKLKHLAAQRYQIETTLAKLSSCLQFMRENLRILGNKSAALVMKKTTKKQVKELTTPLPPDILKPNTEADIMFSASEEMPLQCQNYGQVLTLSLPDPSQCRATGQGLEMAVVGEKSTAILHAINCAGKPCEEPIESLNCKLSSELTFDRANCTVKRRGKSQFVIRYQPTVKGKHQLHIKVESQHISGSPFSLIAMSPVEKIGAPIMTTSVFLVRGPQGVTMNRRGEVVVTSGSGHYVSVFSPSGEKISSFGACGSGFGRFQAPCGVAVDNDGNYLVSEFNNNRIQKFTAQGQFLAAVGTKGSGPLQFLYPLDIAFNASNNLVYVVDKGNNRVQVMNSDFVFSTAFGRKGSGRGQFDSPCGIACDSTGKVYVVDSKNSRVQVFTAEGTFLSMFGRRGQGRGELEFPNSVAVDTSGMVYVSEGQNHRVSVFSSKGNFVTFFGKEGEGPGEFKWPRGLGVDTSGVLYVCDCGNNCVKVF